jgi:hypothetical protein
VITDRAAMRRAELRLEMTTRVRRSAISRPASPTRSTTRSPTSR